MLGVAAAGGGWALGDVENTDGCDVTGMGKGIIEAGKSGIGMAGR